MKWIKHKAVFQDAPGYEFIFIMDENGYAHGEVYFDADDKKAGYLKSLSVQKKYRKLGMGTKLQLLREAIIKRRGYKYSMLWVIKDSWMREWYERRGYKFYCKHTKYRGCIWMRKTL